MPDITRGLLPRELIAMRHDARRIAIVTAYDAPAGRAAEAAGVDAILVGDSAAMTVLGYQSTVYVSVAEMLMLTAAVRRGAPNTLLIGDLPFGSYQASDAAAIRHAARFIREGGATAVKLEGAGRQTRRAAAIAAAGIPVVGHIGLTPQSAVALGGYRPQGRTPRDAARLLDEAVALEAAGCFAIVLEAIPAEVAASITAALRVPTIGIGAGASCSGQVLVWHDLLGLTEGRTPRFVKRYASVGETVANALKTYVAEVRDGSFPEARHTYAMADGERRAE